MSSARLPYDPFHPNWSLLRQIFFNRLRVDDSFRQIPAEGEGFENFVQFQHPANPDRRELGWHMLEVFWQLVIEGIVAPGLNPSNPNLPWFHVTPYGRKVLDAGEYQPHDTTGYLQRLTARVSTPDPTVVTYVQEALETFQRRNLIAAMVMLGVAAEQVFLLLCDSMEGALSAPRERARLQTLRTRTSIKPVLDWIHAKIVAVHAQRLPGFPENAPLMVTAIYDMIRSQRNDLGHPQPRPPRLDIEECFANLQIFPTYYETAQRVRQFLGANKV